MNENFDAIRSAVEARAADVDLQLEQLRGVENVLTVSASGGDYTSVAAALNDTTDASDSNRYLVRVGPGVYDETELLPIGASSRSRGPGPRPLSSAPVAAATRRTTTRPWPCSAAEGAIADLTIENLGGPGVANGVTIVGGARTTMLRNVRVRVATAGGTGYAAVRMIDSDATLLNCDLFVSGATQVNAGVTVTDGGGPFSRPLLKGCVIEGDQPNRGIGVFASGTSLEVDDCRIRGDFRGISLSVNGVSTIRLDAHPNLRGLACLRDVRRSVDRQRALPVRGGPAPRHLDELQVRALRESQPRPGGQRIRLLGRLRPEVFTRRPQSHAPGRHPGTRADSLPSR